MSVPWKVFMSKDRPWVGRLLCDELTGSESTNDSCAADGRVDDGDHIGEFTLEGRVEVGTGLERSQAVAVGEFGEYADVAAVLELDACEITVRSCPLRG